MHLRDGGWRRATRHAASRALEFVTSYQHQAMTLLVFVLVLDYADRTLIGALGPTLKRVFSINNAELGLLVTVFAIVSALATIPLGMIVDRFRRTWLIAISLLFWVAAEFLTGAAASYLMLIVVRIFLGIVSAASGPTMPSLVGDLVPGTERGRALASIDSGLLIGSGVGFVLPAIVLGFASWRVNFWILAAAGLLLAVGFWILPEPKRTGAGGPGEAGADHPSAGRQLSQVQQIVQHRDVRPDARAMVNRDPADVSLWYAIKYTIRVRTDLIALLSRSAGDFWFQGISVFAVVFASSWYHLSERQAELVFIVIGVGAFLGILVIGRLSDWLLRREHITGRIWLGSIAYIIAPIALFFGILTRDLWVAIPLFLVGAFMLGGAEPTLDAVRIDVLVPRLRGRAEAIRTVMRTVAEASAPIIIGWLSGTLAGGGTKGLQEALLITLPLVLVAGFVMLLAVPTYAPDVAAALASSNKIEEHREAEEDEEDHEEEAEGRQPPRRMPPTHPTTRPSRRTQARDREAEDTTPTPSATV